jgi:hypothetical protein
VPDSLTYVWKRNGKAIAGATAATYQVTPADVAKKLSVTVTGRKAGYGTVSVTSASTAVAKADFTTVGVPTVKGDPVVGGTLTADPGTWAPTPAGINYQWYSGTTQLRNATAATLTLAAAQSGAELRVRVRVGRPGYRTTTVYSQKVAVAKVP